MECDAQQVVFNAKYVEYIDIAFTEFMKVLFGSYSNLLEAGMDTQVVSVTVNWKAPAIFDEVIAITIKTKRIGNTSFTFDIQYYNYQEKKEIASAEITYVMVDAIKHTKKVLPPEVREKLEKGAPGIVVDHAGMKGERNSSE